PRHSATPRTRPPCPTCSRRSREAITRVASAARDAALSGPRCVDRQRDSGGRDDRQIEPVPPLVPRADVVPHARVAGEREGDVALRGAIAALAVGDDLALGRDARLRVHRAQLADGTVAAVAGEIARPLDVDGPGNRTAARGADELASVLGAGADVDDRHVGTIDRSEDVLDGGEPLRMALDGELRGRGLDGVARERPALVAPAPDAT